MGAVVLCRSTNLKQLSLHSSFWDSGGAVEILLGQFLLTDSSECKSNHMLMLMCTFYTHMF